MNELFVWGELYRPSTIDECILPASIKDIVKDVIATGNIPSFIFSGPAGCGKTSLAYAIANEIGADLMYINASRETSIDVIRDRVVSYCSSVSMEGNQKIVLLDEFDGMSQKAMDSLKGTYEEFPHVRFILTTNSLAKIIEPIRSRSKTIEFKISKADRPKLSAAMLKRVIAILDEHEVAYKVPVLVEFVNKFFPDFRRILNELQVYSASGTIDSSILLGGSGTSREIINALRKKDFKAMRTWVGENASDDTAQLFEDFYENAFEYFEPASVPQLILLLGEYQFKAAHNLNPKINLAAFFTMVMVECTFKE